jgi:hypothetical protein
MLIFSLIDLQVLARDLANRRKEELAATTMRRQTISNISDQLQRLQVGYHWCYSLR